MCTANYVKKANEGRGGVGYEKMIVSAELMRNIETRRVIPVIRQRCVPLVPTFLKTKLYIDFTNDQGYDYAFDELLRTVHGSPLYKKPPIGPNPFEQDPAVVSKPKPPATVSDPIRELMVVAVEDFEEGNDYCTYDGLAPHLNMSRIMLDRVIAEAAKMGLITVDDDGDLKLTEKGKDYAIEQGLVPGL